jgi:predicted nucleic acid-binding protein
MFAVLDTNHFREYSQASVSGGRLMAKIEAEKPDLFACIETLGKLTLLPFDREAAMIFHELVRTHPRIGTMDLKIAAICLEHDATLLTRNLLDFEKIPGLRVENWLD